jgi:putative membrane-bound dehydrogenase-like protein
MKHAYRLALLLALAGRAVAADTSVPKDLFKLSDPDLEITLWASTPQLKNPTNLDFDKDGRVWVAEGVNYRSHYDRQKEGDRIVILEDTDGDGVADKSDVFVQEPGLRAPMGIAVIDNQVVVSMSPDILVYTDVNRDRKFDPAVDKKEVLLTGFNGRRHDHTVHSVSVGPDGQWYWNSGNCGAMFTDKSGKTFRIGSAYDPTYGGGKGDLGWRPTEIAGQKSDDGYVWVGGFAARMNPDGSAVRIIGHNFRNSYEQAVTSYGDVFQNDNDDPPACRTAFLLEFGNAGFCSFDGLRSWGADRRPGQSVPTAEWRQEDPGTMPAGDVYGGGSPTGIAYYEEGVLGAKYRGLLLSCEPGRNVVFGYLPKPDGAGFKLERFDFLTTNPEGQFAGTDFQGGSNEKRALKTMFRPSDVSVGPDGAVYVTDWFDARVGGHADWDDTVSGSIYRIARKGSKSKAPKVDFTSVDGAIAGLKSPAVNVRGAAQEALARQGAKATKALLRLLKDENPYVQARAVWLLSRDGGKGVSEVAGLLSSPDAQTRVVAFRALRRLAEQGAVQGGRSPVKVPGTPEFVRAAALQLASDPSAAVRREVALSMRDVPLEQSKDILLAVARTIDGSDRTLLEAWGAGAAGRESALYDAVKPVLNNADPLRWSPGFASLAWRLHPEQSVADFKARALATSLDLKSRRDALTAIGYNPAAVAAEAMLEIAAGAEGTVKADATWWLINRKDNVWKAHNLGPALKSRKIYDPDAVELISATIPAAEAPKFTVADVAKLTGDAKRGHDRFVTLCTSCHRAGDEGVEYAPNLTGWARRQTAEVFFNSVINPSADIAHGFNGTALKLKEDVEIHGIVISDGDPVVIQSAAGVIQTVPKNRIVKRGGLGRSLMMSADQLGLVPQDLADIQAYLRTK